MCLKTTRHSETISVMIFLKLDPNLSQTGRISQFAVCPPYTPKGTAFKHILGDKGDV